MPVFRHVNSKGVMTGGSLILAQEKKEPCAAIGDMVNNDDKPMSLPFYPLGVRAHEFAARLIPERSRYTPGAGAHEYTQADIEPRQRHDRSDIFQLYSDGISRRIKEELVNTVVGGVISFDIQYLDTEVIRVFARKIADNVYITEVVTQGHYENDKKITNSYLVLEDITTDKKILVNDLLPFGYDMAPGVLEKGIDFESYKGFGSSSAEEKGANLAFLKVSDKTNSRNGFVTYGDIDFGKDGLSAVFHEIGHTWQSVHGLPFGGMTFKNVDAVMQRAVDFIEENEINNTTLMALQKYFQSMVQRMHITTPIHVVFSMTHDPSDIQPDDDLIVFKHKKNIKLSVTHGWLSELVKKWVNQERDAHAYGLTMLHFLRDEGIDITGQMKTVTGSMFNKRMLNALLTAQNALGAKIDGDLTKLPCFVSRVDRGRRLESNYRVSDQVAKFAMDYFGI